MAERNGMPPPTGMGRGRMRGRPVEKPKDLKGTTLRLWSLTKGHRKGLGWILLLSAFTSISSILSPLVIGSAVTAVDRGNPLIVLVLTLLGLYLCDWLVRFCSSFLCRYGQRIIHYIRVTLFSVMKNLPLAFLIKTAWRAHEPVDQRCG